MTSLNHYALGAVVDWMHRTIGGLSALEPGYRRVRIAPQPGGGLTSATLRHDTRHGAISIAWALENGAVSVGVVVPEGVEAEVVLPLHPEGDSAIMVGAGEHFWEYALAEGAAERRSYSLDSTLRQIADDALAWKLFTEAFSAHYPGVPLDGSAPEAAAMSVRTMLDFVPGASEQLRSDLTVALEAASQGA
ncbi:alpha-L-rhamnosidase C-terminal domain-containing protein [Microterricola viridarii]|uniref:alpha-L-rhamnosidase C-terminal domain-containing protein n=1 Tax=Microterricola viridarii TaxID=412690 RepID=UPI002FF76012